MIIVISGPIIDSHNVSLEEIILGGLGLLYLNILILVGVFILWKDGLKMLLVII